MFTLIVQRDSLDEIFLSQGKEQLVGFKNFLYDVRSLKLVIDVPLAEFVDYSNSNPLYEALTESISDYCFEPFLSIENVSKYFQKFVFGIVNVELETALGKRGYPAISQMTFNNWEIYNTQGSPKSWEVSSQDSNFTISSWTKLNHIRHSWNSLFMLDYYLLSDKWETQEKGWVGLIDQILANDSEECHITVVPLGSVIKDPFGKKTRLFSSDRDSIIENIKQRFHSQLAHHRADGKRIKSCIALMDEDRTLEGIRIHDRYLITNGFFIESRSGFNVFGGNSLPETTISCQFVFFSHVAYKVEKRLERWSNYLNSLEHKPQTGTVPGSKNWFGDKRKGFFSSQNNHED